MVNKLVFEDLSLIEELVLIAGREYVLREASESVACQYRNALLRCTKLGPDGRPQSIDGLADVEPLLVSLCLFEQTDKGERSVPLATVRSWPSRVVKPLFERAKAISLLDEAEKTTVEKQEELRNGSSGDAAKNLPAGGERTSSLPTS